MKKPVKRLLFPVMPKKGESLVGLLMRAAENNGLKSPTSILNVLNGKIGRPPRVEHIEDFAEMIGCDPTLIPPLFGFVNWRNGEKQWDIEGNVLTKEYFVRSRSVAVCPYCLKEDVYLRASWELTPYVTCSRHECFLIDHCESCSRPLRWNRNQMAFCPCGHDLRITSIQRASSGEIFLSWLIDWKLDYSSHVNPKILNVVHRDVLTWLSKLSLDELFRSVWFLGHCLADFENTGKGHGVRKGQLADAANIVQRWRVMLQDWPSKFDEKLLRISDRKFAQTSMGLMEKTFGPVHTYIVDELKGENLEYLHQAYKRFVICQWGKYLRPPKSIFDGQLQLIWE